MPYTKVKKLLGQRDSMLAKKMGQMRQLIMSKASNCDHGATTTSMGQMKEVGESCIGCSSNRTLYCQLQDSSSYTPVHSKAAPTDSAANRANDGACKCCAAVQLLLEPFQTLPCTFHLSLNCSLLLLSTASMEGEL